MKIKKLNENIYSGQMTVGELKEKLNKFNNDDIIMILDGFNGQGNPRTINFGPIQDEIDPEYHNGADIDNMNVNDKFICMGYGCY